jgi:hypothetical protein
VLNFGKNPVIASLFWAVALREPSLAIFMTVLFFKAISILASRVNGSSAKTICGKRIIAKTIKKGE